jgi:hypothetical protein
MVDTNVSWSVMAVERVEKYETEPMNGRYFAFSVEEGGSVQ